MSKPPAKPTARKPSAPATTQGVGKTPRSSKADQPAAEPAEGKRAAAKGTPDTPAAAAPPAPKQDAASTQPAAPAKPESAAKPATKPTAAANAAPPAGAPAATPAPPAGAPAATKPQTQITVSRGMGNWLTSHGCSLAFTSYQTGQLFLVGVLPNGSVSFNQQNFSRAMGVSCVNGRLYLGSLFQVWRLENMLRAGEVGNGSFDAVYVPRNAQTTGDIDVHELGVDREGRVVFINTKYSCLATLDLTHSFKPIWKPPFISKLAAEDRCHLNGLAMVDGRAKYVTAVSRSDVVTGWRARRHEGGVVIEVETGRIVTDQLSMPHSPRVVEDKLFVLDSGRGQLVEVDQKTGKRREIAFAPGFMRGLAIHRGHAIVTLSKPRDGSFKELALEEELKKRDGEAWCGVVVINLASGDIVEWIRLEGEIVELFDVTAIPGVRCPMSIGVGTTEMQSTVTFEKL